MPNLQELRESRGKAVAAARKIHEEAGKASRSMTADEQRQFDAYMDESDKLGEQIKAEERSINSRNRLKLADQELEERNSADDNAGDDVEDDESDESEERGADDAGDEDDLGEDGRRAQARGSRRERRGGGRDENGRRGSAGRLLRRWRVANGEERRFDLSGPRGSAEYREDYQRWLATGVQSRRLLKGHEEIRALSADTDIEGGYLSAPMQMVADLVKFVDDAVFIRQHATVYQVPNAQSLGAPSLDADPDDGEWTSEIETGSDDSGMKFGRRELHPSPLAKRIKVTRKLLRTAVMNAEMLVRQRLGYKFAITQEKNFLTGDGANKPLGLYVASSLGISTSRDVSTGNTSTAIGADGLIEAKFALKPQYWAKARWNFHRTAIKQIRLLKDSTNQYLWQPGLAGGEPDTVLNLPYDMSEYTPSTFTTGKYVGLLGDFSFYWIAEALSLEIQMLDQLYAEKNQIGFIGRAEVDAMPVLEEAFVRVKLG